MRVLIDTCVLSELHRGNAIVRKRFESIDSSNLFLSVIVIGEIVNGIARLKPSKRRRDLEAWLDQIEQFYGSHILPVDIETARIWGEITASASRKGNVLPIADGLIASTAIRHGMHVMTRNSPHFTSSGAMVIDPWED